MKGFIINLIERHTSSAAVINPLLSPRFEPVFPSRFPYWQKETGTGIPDINAPAENEMLTDVISDRNRTVFNPEPALSTIRLKEDNSANATGEPDDSLSRIPSINISGTGKKAEIKSFVAGNQPGLKDQDSDIVKPVLSADYPSGKLIPEKNEVSPSSLAETKQFSIGHLSGSKKTDTLNQKGLNADKKAGFHKRSSKQLIIERNDRVVPPANQTIDERLTMRLGIKFGDNIKQQPDSPSIKVTIGKIEIRAVQASSIAKSASEKALKPRLSLEDYLKKRNNA